MWDGDGGSLRGQAGWPYANCVVRSVRALRGQAGLADFAAAERCSPGAHRGQAGDLSVAAERLTQRSTRLCWLALRKLRSSFRPCTQAARTLEASSLTKNPRRVGCSNLLLCCGLELQRWLIQVDLFFGGE